MLDLAANELQRDIDNLNELRDSAIETARHGKTGPETNDQRFARIKETVLRRELLGHLGTVNVLPKYSFSVGVVELHTHHIQDATAHDLTLTRDLRQTLTGTLCCCQSMTRHDRLLHCWRHFGYDARTHDRAKHLQAKERFVADPERKEGW